MTSDFDKLEQSLRRATPRGLSPEATARITSVLRGETAPTTPGPFTHYRWFVPAAAAMAIITTSASLVLHLRVQPSQRILDGTRYVSQVAQTTILPREDLGLFVSDSGAPIEAFRYRFMEKSVWRRSDGKRSLETAIPLEAVVWVETPVY